MCVFAYLCVGVHGCMCACLWDCVGLFDFVLAVAYNGSVAVIRLFWHVRVRVCVCVFWRCVNVCELQCVLEVCERV